MGGEGGGIQDIYSSLYVIFHINHHTEVLLLHLKCITRFFSIPKSDQD